MLPGLLVVGAQKSGTQSLTHYLDAQPGVRMCRRELDFFSADDVWRRGLDWYVAQLPPAQPGDVVGETSPSYSMRRAYPEAAPRIAQVLPAARIVYLMRDPVERVLSAYRHGLVRGAETRPLRRAVLDEFYLDASRYATQIRRYLEFFPREQLLLLTTDELRDRRAQTVERVLRFAGVERAVDDVPLATEVNTATGRRVPRAWARRLGGFVLSHGLERRVPAALVRWREQQSPVVTRPLRAREQVVPPAVRAELAARLRQEVEQLRAWLGPGFDGWGLSGQPSPSTSS